MGEKKRNFRVKHKKSLSEIKFNQSFSEKLKQFRKKANLTQEDMEQYGINVRQYQRLESGRQTPTIPTLIHLSEILKIKLSDFF
jgi:transcriptional regulator with XRE-family HTH domain